MLAVLVRPLASDDQRARFWERHARNGVLLSELVAVMVTAYALVTTTPARHDEVVLLLVALTAVGSPLLLLLPVARMCRGRSGTCLFYGWSVGTTAVIAVAAVRDGGSASPLFSLLFLTLGFMAMAYPAGAVAVIGSAMTLTYLFVVCAGSLDLFALFVAMMMATFTSICTVTARLQWRAHDEQVLLLRTQEMLAATDPLTGCLNRRAFLRRLEDLCRGSADVILLVGVIDLDGFKAVNDSEGHAAGDLVLVDVARALGSTLPETETVARLGGDEFAVIVALGSAAEAVPVSDRLRREVGRVGADRGATASVGYTLVNRGDDAHAVLIRADHAMYAAKATGGDRARCAPAS